MILTLCIVQGTCASIIYNKNNTIFREPVVEETEVVSEPSVFAIAASMLEKSPVRKTSQPTTLLVCCALPSTWGCAAKTKRTGSTETYKAQEKATEMSV